MPYWSVTIEVTLKKGVLDPQGQAIEHALHALGHETVDRVRQGKVIQLRVQAATEGEARQSVEKMCHELLSNPVMESHEIHIVPDLQQGAA